MKAEISYKVSGKVVHKVIHLVSPFILDYSLCGQDLAGDSLGDTSYDSANYDPKGRINCERCFQIVAFSKKVKATCFSKKLVEPDNQ